MSVKPCTFVIAMQALLIRGLLNDSAILAHYIKQSNNLHRSRCLDPFSFTPKTTQAPYIAPDASIPAPASSGTAPR